MKKIIAIIMCMMMILTSGTVVFASDNMTTVLYECEDVLSSDEVYELLVSTSASSDNYITVEKKNNTNKLSDADIILEGADSAEGVIKELGSVSQIVNIEMDSNGEEIRTRRVTEVYEWFDKDDVNSNTSSPRGSGQDQTAAIRMYLTTIIQEVTRNNVIYGRVTDACVNYQKLDSQVTVENIYLSEYSDTKLYNSNFQYIETDLFIKFLQNIGNPSTTGVYYLSNYSGINNLSGRYGTLSQSTVLGTGYVGTRAIFTIKRTNGTSTWTGTIYSRAYNDATT